MDPVIIIDVFYYDPTCDEAHSPKEDVRSAQRLQESVSVCIGICDLIHNFQCGWVHPVGVAEHDLNYLGPDWTIGVAT